MERHSLQGKYVDHNLDDGTVDVAYLKSAENGSPPSDAASSGDTLSSSEQSNLVVDFVQELAQRTAWFLVSFFSSIAHLDYHISSIPISTRFFG